jgi:trehalose synthase
VKLELIPVGELPLDGFDHVLSADGLRALQTARELGHTELAGRRVWNVSSTARGGGVAEMLTTVLAYARGAGVDARWAVVCADAAFFAITKRIHNRLHGFDGDGGPLGEAERAVYEAELAPNGFDFCSLLEPGDLVILHDPQTAGLIPLVREAGIPVVWRCHVGLDVPNAVARAAWRFLEPYVMQADAYVFSREAFVWDELDPARRVIIAPSIDVFSPKNADLAPATVDGVLESMGLRDLRYVLQVSRWDSLKDPIGVVNGFAEHVAPHTDAHLVCAGPDVTAIADDPEGAAVYAATQDAWSALPDAVRDRVHVALLPMADATENATIVNALQRSAEVVVQKSVAEGFGLTVAEAMWKSRPVVASRIGGIQDQIEHGVNGLLLDDPRDLREYGAAVLELLNDPARASAMGRAAHERVRARYLGSHSLVDYLALLERVMDGRLHA